MRLTEIKKDLFTVDRQKYVLAHCISADCAMGAGIAVQFDKRFPGLKKHCKAQRPKVGDAVFYNWADGRVFNLVTKERYWHKPTYGTLKAALEDMKTLVMVYGFKYLAMPTIGSGLDRLAWPRVKAVITDVFADTDVEILVCVL